MISSDPLTRRCKSSERTEGTMRSLSPLAIRVGWVSFDRSWGVPRPHVLIAFNCVRNALTLIDLTTRAAATIGIKAFELDWRIWEASRGGALPYPQPPTSETKTTSD
jgi:hypothetical protein